MKKISLCTLALSMLVGCSSGGLRFKDTPEGNQSVANVDEAGSVHVAIIAVTPWENIKAKLRPNLQIDEKDLRSQSIPVTFALLDKYLDILRLQAAIAPTTVKTTSTSTSTGETGKDSVNKSDTTTTTGPGEPRKTEVAPVLASGSAPSLTASGAGAINSSLTARAMASYVQDIQALNAEVDGAANRTGYEPYLVRVQVSVMPRRRHLGYDVYSNLSFFGYKGRFDSQTGEAVERESTKGTPFVVPLLSSDSVETAQRSQSLEALRDVGVALDLVKGFGSVGASANSQKDRQQALQGLDVNSVLTMGRLSDNTLRVRFGAAFDPGGGYSTHPRTNTISVLVFFPKNAELSRVVSRTSWMHVLDGTVLERSQQHYVDRLKPIEAQWNNLGLSIERLMAIDEFPLEGNYQGFTAEMDATLSTYCKPSHGADAKSWKQPTNCTIDHGKVIHELNMPNRREEKERTYAYVWAHLLSVLPGSRFSSTVFDLPKVEPLCPVVSQLSAYVEDDKGITVALRGGRDLTNSNLRAAVHMNYTGVPNRPAAVAASRTSVIEAHISPNSVSGKSTIRRDSESTAVQDAASRNVYAGALVASNAIVSDDRSSMTLSFATAGMEPTDGSKPTGIAPVAVEVAGCKVAKPAPLLPENFALKRLFGEDSQFYILNAKIPKKANVDSKEKPDAKDKATTVGLNATTNNLLLDKDSLATTTLTVDLGSDTKSQLALTAVGAVIKSALPAGSLTRRSDGSYLVKGSGPVDITLANVLSNQDVDIELRAIDEKNKLGPLVKKLTLNARTRS